MWIDDIWNLISILLLETTLQLGVFGLIRMIHLHNNGRQLSQLDIELVIVQGYYDSVIINSLFDDEIMII